MKTVWILGKARKAAAVCRVFSSHPGASPPYSTKDWTVTLHPASSRHLGGNSWQQPHFSANRASVVEALRLLPKVPRLEERWEKLQECLVFLTGAWPELSDAVP